MAGRVLVLIAPLAQFLPKTYALVFSFPLSQSSRLTLATPRVPGRFMSLKKTERQLRHLSGKVMMLRKISHQEGSPLPVLLSCQGANERHRVAGCYPDSFTVGHQPIQLICSD